RDVKGFGWSGQSVGGVGASQRLNPDQGLRVEVPDGLEDGLKTSLLDQPRDGFLLLRGGHDHVLADVLEVRGTVAAPALGLIQRGIGLGTPRVGLESGAQGADADADLDAGVCEVATQSPRQDSGALGVGVRQQERELIAPDPVSAISRPCLSQDSGDTLEYRVALRVALTVV